MPLTPAELVRAHARAYSLVTLKTVVASGGLASDRLRRLDANLVERGCLDAAFRLWAADVSLLQAEADATAALNLIESAKQSSVHVSFLPKTAALRRIIGHTLGDCLVADIKDLQTAWDTAKDLLHSLDLGTLLSLVGAVDLVAGFHGPSGEIRSLSNQNFPGFIAIGIDGPELLLAEHTVHESMHVVLAACFALRDELRDLADERVGVLSPFADSVRTTERVVHGILSYTAVKLLWDAVAKCATPECWMAVRDRNKARAIAARRVRVLNSRLELAMTCLFDGAGEEVCRKTIDLASEFLNAQLPRWQLDGEKRRLLVASAGYPLELVDLSSIQRAELALAICGQKVSRISLPIERIPRVGFAIVARAAVAGSSRVIYPIADNRIGGFSNIVGESAHVLAARPDAEVHLYVHARSSDVRRAAFLDGEDGAGELLGIPQCCRKWYAHAWPRARETGGDLFSEMVRLAARNGRTSVAAECDASAMYRGGGLCWHFPCSPQCPETVAVVRTRRKRLEALDPTLLAELDGARRHTVTILADGTYEDGEVNGEGTLIVSFV